ncbi:MAG: RNA polymerase sigma factor [Candidatus Aminicenantes bacterium]|nr:RNA polymerase sigma factor [Candidatus Aminicenantes bacterium]
MTESKENAQLADLIRQGAEGDERALEAIYRRFKRPLFSLACRYTGNASAAEDVLQEVFLRVFTRLGEVNNPATFSAWLYRITINASLSQLRASRHERRAAVPLGDVEDVLAAPAVGADGGDLRRPLEDAIRELPARLKSVFLLHDVQGFKHEEISSMLGLSTGTTKSHLFKARMRLRNRLLRTGALASGKSKE